MWITIIISGPEDPVLEKLKDCGCVWYGDYQAIVGSSLLNRLLKEHGLNELLLTIYNDKRVTWCPVNRFFSCDITEDSLVLSGEAAIDVDFDRILKNKISPSGRIIEALNNYIFTEPFIKDAVDEMDRKAKMVK